MGKHLWYRDGALELLKRIQKAKVKDPLDPRAPEQAAAFWMTNSTHDPKDVLDTCFALLFLKRATKDMVPAPITPPTEDPSTTGSAPRAHGAYDGGPARRPS